jgi:hypothetical protein
MTALLEMAVLATNGCLNMSGHSTSETRSDTKLTSSRSQHTRSVLTGAIADRRVAGVPDDRYLTDR